MQIIKMPLPAMVNILETGRGAQLELNLTGWAFPGKNSLCVSTRQSRIGLNIFHKILWQKSLNGTLTTLYNC